MQRVVKPISGSLAVLWSMTYWLTHSYQLKHSRKQSEGLCQMVFAWLVCGPILHTHFTAMLQGRGLVFINITVNNKLSCRLALLPFMSSHFMLLAMEFSACDSSTRIYSLMNGRNITVLAVAEQYMTYTSPTSNLCTTVSLFPLFCLRHALQTCRRLRVIIWQRSPLVILAKCRLTVCTGWRADNGEQLVALLLDMRDSVSWP